MLLEKNIDNYFELISKYQEIVNINNQIVTIFILTHDRNNYFQQMVKSVLSQTYSNFSLLILDDCDKGADKIIEQQNDDRAFYFRLQCDYVCDKLYFANTICCTDYLIILHDDDMVEPQYLSEMIGIMQKNKCDAISSASYYINETSERIQQNYNASGQLLINKNETYFINFISNKGFLMNFPSTIYSTKYYKKFYEDAMPFNYKEIGPCFDQWIWFETCRRGGVLGYYDKPLYDYRLHSEQDGHINAGKMELQLLEFLLKDAYYSKLFVENKNCACERILSIYKTFTKQYYNNVITRKWYSDKFNSPVFSFLSSSMKGKYYSFLIKAAYFFGPVAKLMPNHQY